MKSFSWLLAVAAGAVLSGAALGDDRVLIVPFDVMNVPEAQQWIGRGVQENLVADMGRNGGMDPILFQGQVIVEDNATAARLARNANAPLVIRGAAQMAGGDVRLTAQLIDSKSGDTVRTALVTGPTGDLLKLEDELARQLRSAAVPPAPTAPAASAPATPAVPVMVPVAPSQIIVISQPQPVYYPSDAYAYGYPLGYYPWVVYQVMPGNRGHGHGRGEGGGGGGGVHIVQNGGGGGFNPYSLPLPTNFDLPLPTNYVQPLPTNMVLPLPTNHGAPIPTIAPAVPRANAGQNRDSRMVN